MIDFTVEQVVKNWVEGKHTTILNEQLSVENLNFVTETLEACSTVYNSYLNGLLVAYNAINKIFYKATGMVEMTVEEFIQESQKLVDDVVTKEFLLMIFNKEYEQLEKILKEHILKFHRQLFFMDEE